MKQKMQTYLQQNLSPKFSQGKINQAKETLEVQINSNKTGKQCNNGQIKNQQVGNYYVQNNFSDKSLTQESLIQNKENLNNSSLQKIFYNSPRVNQPLQQQQQITQPAQSTTKHSKSLNTEEYSKALQTKKQIDQNLNRNSFTNNNNNNNNSTIANQNNNSNNAQNKQSHLVATRTIHLNKEQQQQEKEKAQTPKHQIFNSLERPSVNKKDSISSQRPKSSKVEISQKKSKISRPQSSEKSQNIFQYSQSSQQVRNHHSPSNQVGNSLNFDKKHKRIFDIEDLNSNRKTENSSSHYQQKSKETAQEKTFFEKKTSMNNANPMMLNYFNSQLNMNSPKINNFTNQSSNNNYTNNNNQQQQQPNSNSNVGPNIQIEKQKTQGSNYKKNSNSSQSNGVLKNNKKKKIFSNLQIEKKNSAKLIKENKDYSSQNNNRNQMQEEFQVPEQEQYNQQQYQNNLQQQLYTQRANQQQQQYQQQFSQNMYSQDDTQNLYNNIDVDSSMQIEEERIQQYCKFPLQLQDQNINFPQNSQTVQQQQSLYQQPPQVSTNVVSQVNNHGNANQVDLLKSFVTQVNSCISNNKNNSKSKDSLKKNKYSAQNFKNQENIQKDGNNGNNQIPSSYLKNSQKQLSKQQDQPQEQNHVNEQKQEMSRINQFQGQDQTQQTFIYYISSLINAFKNPDDVSYFSLLAREHIVQTMQAISFTRMLNPVSEKMLEEKMIYLPKKNNNKKTLVLDLDETLIHCQDANLESDIVLPIKFPSGELIEAGINIRPFCLQFLQDMSKYYEIIVFTASHSCYANVVLDYLDPENKYIQYRLFRENCIQTDEGIYIKDLRVLMNRNLKDITIVDNAAYSFGFQIENGLPILPYYDNQADTELKILATYLKSVHQVTDIRDVNNKILKISQFGEYDEPQQLLQSLFSCNFN